MLAFGIKDLIDILLVAILMYTLFKIMKASGGTKVFIGIMVFITIWFLVSNVFRLPMTGAIFDNIVKVGILALVVLFQGEIRKFFFNLGSTKLLGFLKRFSSFLQEQDDEEKAQKASAQVVNLVNACRHMSAGKVGALIVIERDDNIQHLIDTGDVFRADINTRLVENIFFKNSPLHDGAMIIRDHEIAAAGCILPVSNNEEIPRHLGLRHRAAMGMAEKYDSLVIIVSEETGNISVAFKGKYMLNLSPEELQRVIMENVHAARQSKKVKTETETNRTEQYG